MTFNVDGSGRSTISTGIGFDHMLDELARHSLVDIEISARGDLHIDIMIRWSRTPASLRTGAQAGPWPPKGVSRYADVALLG